MAHDEYEHQRRQTAALERIADLLEMKITADDLRAQWEEQEADRNASPILKPVPLKSRVSGYHIHLPVYDDENDTCVGYVEQPVDSRLVVITEPPFVEGVGDAFQKSGDDTIWMS